MALNKIKIGKLISLNDTKNTKNLDLSFYGINKNKEFMPTVAATDNLDRSKYKVMTKGRFVFSGMQTGRDMCIRIGLYNNNFDALISPAYTTFDITSEEVLPEYFFMLFNSSEMDRYGAFLSDGSIRSNLDWNVFCNIELSLPSVDVQKKYVAVYKAMLHNHETYQAKIDDLKLVCDAYIEDLRRKIPCQELGSFIKQYDERNVSQCGIESVRGITTQKEFIDTKADMNGVSLSNYKIVKPSTFAYVADTSRRGNKISLSLNSSLERYLVSSITTTFEIEQSEVLHPKYLFLFMKRSEFDRFARYNSWGSAREAFEWDALCELKIPIPDIKVQKSIVKIHDSLLKRKLIADTLKAKISEICPILISGAIKEGGGK